MGPLEITLTLLGVVVLLRVLPVVIVTWRLATIAWSRPSETVVPSERVPDAYRALFADLHGVLGTLGFEDVSWFGYTSVLAGRAPEKFAFAMQHSEHPIFAWLSVDNPFDTRAPVAIRLQTPLSDGLAVATHDFTAHGEISDPLSDIADVCAFDVRAQLDLHLARIADQPSVDLEAAEFAAFRAERCHRIWGAWLADGQVVLRGDGFGMSWRAASRVAARMIRGNALRERALQSKPSFPIPTELLVDALESAQFQKTKRSVAFRVGSYLTSFAALVGSFALLLTWQSGLALALVVAFHEFGHYVAMRALGYRDARVYLIPFAGGAAVAGQGHETSLGARLGIYLAGPVPGLIAAACLLPVQHASEFMGDLVAFLAVVNFVNLLPILPLDGGRVAEALASEATPWVRPLLAGGSSILLVGVGVVVGDPLLLVLGILAAFLTRSEWRNTRIERDVRATGADDEAIARAVCASGLAASGKLLLFKTLRERVRRAPISPLEFVLGGLVYAAVGVLSLGVTILSL